MDLEVTGGHWGSLGEYEFGINFQVDLGSGPGDPPGPHRLGEHTPVEGKVLKFGPRVHQQPDGKQAKQASKQAGRKPGKQASKQAAIV